MGTEHNRVPVVVRPASPEDEAFIISSFLKSRRAEGDAKHMTNDVYYAGLVPEAERLARGAVIVAHVPGDPWLIMGWLAYEPWPPHGLLYAYTKFSFRRMGVFDSLMRRINPASSAMVCRRVGRCFPMLRDRYSLTFDPGGSQ